MNLQSIEKSVVEICREVGKFILKEGSSFDRSRIEQKTDFNNLVSYVDKEAEKKLVKSLREVFPDAGFITEEGTVAQSKNHEYNWIIDPLDGTTNFLHGLPVFAISVGLSRNEEVIVGVVHEMSRDECFHASEGGHAYCNDKIIRTSAVSSMSESLLATGNMTAMIFLIIIGANIFSTFLGKRGRTPLELGPNGRLVGTLPDSG